MKLFDILQDKFKFDLTAGWFPFINTQLKWAVGFFIRIFVIIVTIVIIILVIHKTGALKELKIAFSGAPMDIKDKGATIKSSPNIDHGADIKNLDGVIQMLEKKKGSEKDTPK